MLNQSSYMYTRVLHPFNLFCISSKCFYNHSVLPPSPFGLRWTVCCRPLPSHPLVSLLPFRSSLCFTPANFGVFFPPVSSSPSPRPSHSSRIHQKLASRWIDSSYNGHYPAVTGCFNVPREFYRVAGSNSFINSCLEKVSVNVLQFAQVAKSRSPICKNSTRWCGPEFAGYDIHDFNI